MVGQPGIGHWYVVRLFPCGLRLVARILADRFIGLEILMRRS